MRQTFSSDPATVAAISDALALSRSAITDGLYLGPYAEQSVKALGLEPPPMMWIFEWDIVSGDTATFDTIYTLTTPHVDEAVAQGRRAVATVEKMRDLVVGTAASSWASPDARTQFVAALDYEQNLFTTLDAYRETVLRHAQWLDTGSGAAKAAWKSAETRFRAALADHEHRYGDDLQLPAYNFTAANLGLERADRDVAMAWVARGLLVLVVAALGLGAWSGRRPRFPGHRALHALWTGGRGRGGSDRSTSWTAPAWPEPPTAVRPGASTVCWCGLSRPSCWCSRASRTRGSTHRCTSPSRSARGRCSRSPPGRSSGGGTGSGCGARSVGWRSSGRCCCSRCSRGAARAATGSGSGRCPSSVPPT
ncbi:hypothetical protein GCM10025864_16730 [Luteimicrobium album]|uniref:Uncharacterized protein n=1 Tax=Luteimicrobium album TaxID=1054550 RepID=A0ABQ6I287_9MICO|nr:hypothetical protein [Luteimicrobium album]GMA23914.1 hypothetical protein GCM10025864_16730 [Luteimicrobium album]